MRTPTLRHPGPAAARLDVTVPDQKDPGREVDIARWIAQMQADVAESIGGVMLRAARPVLLALASNASTPVSSSPGRLVGWSVHETSGANPAVLRFHNGGDNSQPLVSCVNVPAGGVANFWMAPGGVSFTEGLFVEVLSGGSLSTAVEGTVFLGAAD